MSDATLENPGLRNMLRPPKTAKAGAGMSEARVWRRTLPRVSEKSLRLLAAIMGFEVTKVNLDDILEAWDDYALTILMVGPDEAHGIVQLDDALRTALVEVQTTGRVLSTKLDGRPGTPLDAALCDHVVNAWLEAAAEDMPQFAGWTASRILRDNRAAKINLDDGDYDSTEIALSLGGGTRNGLMRLLLPHMVGAPAGVPTDAPENKGAVQILGIETALRANLHSTRVRVGWLKDLKVGDLMELPEGVLGMVSVETEDGQRLAGAKLGCVGELRALRLQDDVEMEAPGAPKASFSASGAPSVDMPVADLPMASMPEPEPAGDLPPLGDLPDLPDLPPLE